MYTCVFRPFLENFIRIAGKEILISGNITFLIGKEVIKRL